MHRLRAIERLAFGFGLVALWLYLPGALWAQTLDIRPLGDDPWVSGPESRTNGGYMLTNPANTTGCDRGVRLWVMDIGTPIPDESGGLSMIVGGDTFFRPDNAEYLCRKYAGTRQRLCESVELPGFFDAAYRADCRIDADCGGPPSAPLDALEWRCDSQLGYCVTPDLHVFCNNAYERAYIPGVVSFCYEQRGSHPVEDRASPLRGRAFCEWMAGDHYCRTDLYDDTCDTDCWNRFEECRQNPCGADCIRACKLSGKNCSHRNQTFHDARIEADGAGGYRMRLLGDRPELFIPRLAEEWDNVRLFGVYPGDYFRDPRGALYLLTDTRVWLARSLEQRLSHAGIGVYSMSDQKRLNFAAHKRDAGELLVWEADPEQPTPLRNQSDAVLFARGSRFSEVSVLHGRTRDPYGPGDRKAYLHVLGSGPGCAPEASCLRSSFSDQAHIARMAFSNGRFVSRARLEIFAGLQDGQSVWLSREDAARVSLRPRFAIAGFRAGSVLHWRDEFWHLSELPSVEDGRYSVLHLLRSPDGLTWFDGGSFAVLESESPPMSEHVYAAKWLPPKDTGGELGFLLSHWLSYAGYFMADSPETRFRDYNMKSYRLRPPAPRATLVHSDRYTRFDGSALRLPVTLYQPAQSGAVHLAVQMCVCEADDHCRTVCPPWAVFAASDRQAGPWRYLHALNAKHTDVRATDIVGIPALRVAGNTGDGVLKRAIDLRWTPQKEPYATGRRVLLRFATFDPEKEDVSAQMLESIRVLPDYYQADSERWQIPGGWRVTEPIRLP